MKVIIDRKRWVRGRGADMSALLTRAGKMCCIGFVCEAYGVVQQTMVPVQIPCDLPVEEQQKLPAWLTVSSDADENGARADLFDAFKLNDGRGTVRREERIAELCAKHGLQLEFVDGMETE